MKSAGLATSSSIDTPLLQDKAITAVEGPFAAARRYLLKTLRVSRMLLKAAKFSRRHVKRTSSPVLAAAASSASAAGGASRAREGSMPASSDVSICNRHNLLMLVMGSNLLRHIHILRCSLDVSVRKHELNSVQDM